MVIIVFIIVKLVYLAKHSLDCEEAIGPIIFQAHPAASLSQDRAWIRVILILHNRRNKACLPIKLAFA